MKHNAASATITLVKRQIEAAVSGFRPSATPSDDSFKACAILFAALFVGPKPREIADTMGYDYDYVIEVANRMYASGMWTDSETRYSFNFGEWGQNINTLDAICDVMVAEGMMLRTEKKKNGKYVYQSLIREGQIKN